MFDWFKKSGNSLFKNGNIKSFVDGETNTLNSSDIDPVGHELYTGYEKAVKLKKEGKLVDAEKILIRSCEPPSIYKGHYKELFRVWRKFNRDDLKLRQHQVVTDRVLKMIRFDDEMICEMLRHWSVAQERKLPKDYFDADRNLLISDAKALKKSAEALNNEEHLKLANDLIEKLAQK